MNKFSGTQVSIGFRGALMLLLVVLASCRPEKEAADVSGLIQLEKKLESIVAANELMGMSVVVVKEGEVIYEGGAGLADLERGLPATGNTKYRVASISKSATATALMILYDQGKIDLDADVSQYLDFELRHPRYPGTPITLRMLLSHQASIQDGEGYFAFSRAMFERPLSLRDLFLPDGAFYSEDLFLDHEPGTYFTYANCTWGIIASVIERVSGQRFDEFCYRRIFEPLGMDAGFNVRQLQELDSLAVLYRFDDGQWVAQADQYGGEKPADRPLGQYELGSNGLLFGPQGSLRCSARDLAKFMFLHLNDGKFGEWRLLRPETAQMMHAEQWAFDGTNGDTYHDFFFSWGLGFHRITGRDSMDIVFPGHQMVGHPGEAYGLISDMYFDKAAGAGVIFMTNGSKKAFAPGERTTFYRPEEQTFEAVLEFMEPGRKAAD